MFKTIVVPVDLQDERGAKSILQEAKRFVDEGSELHLMTVLAGYQMPMVASYFPKDMIEKALKAMKADLQKLGTAELGHDQFISTVAEGNAYKAIVKYAKQIDAGLILMSAQKHSAVGKMMLGSVTTKVAQHAKCSVLVLKS